MLSYSYVQFLPRFFKSKTFRLSVCYIVEKAPNWDLVWVPSLIGWLSLGNLGQDTASYKTKMCSALFKSCKFMNEWIFSQDIFERPGWLDTLHSFWYLCVLEPFSLYLVVHTYVAAQNMCLQLILQVSYLEYNTFLSLILNSS